MAKKKVIEEVQTGPCEDCNGTGLLDGVVDATKLCPTCNGTGQLGDKTMAEEVTEETTEEVKPVIEETPEVPEVEEPATEE